MTRSYKLRCNESIGIFSFLETARIQKDLQRKMLENLVIVNENNESFSLAELSDKNVSNPVNRKNELMTRMAGYEEIAKELFR